MSEQRNIVEVAGDDFIRRIEAGENPSIAQYEKQYPMPPVRFGIFWEQFKSSIDSGET